MSTKATVTFTREVIEDPDPDTSYLEAKRLSLYKKGTFTYVGVRATATIRIDYDNRGQKFSYFHELHSPGLWGIESDSGNDYLDEVFKEECDALKADIEAIKEVTFS